MNNVVKLYDNYFDSYEETYDEGELNEKEGRDPKQFKITRVGYNQLPEWLKSKNNFDEAKKLVCDIRIDTSNVNVGYRDKKVFNDLNRQITDVSNNKVKKEDAVKKLEKSISDLNQLRQEESIVFQNKTIQVVYQLFNSFGLNKSLLPLFSQKEPDQLRLLDYVKVSYDRFYKIKNNTDNNKDLMTRIKDKWSKVIIIETRDAVDLIDRVSKNGITYNKIKTIFNDEIIKLVDTIAFENSSGNRTKLLKVFLDLGEVFTRRFCNIKIFDDKYEVVELKNKADDKQSKLENEPSELDKETESKFGESIAERTKLVKQKSDEQPDTTDMPD